MLFAKEMAKPQIAPTIARTKYSETFCNPKVFEFAFIFYWHLYPHEILLIVFIVRDSV